MCEAFRPTTCCLWNIPFVSRLSYFGRGEFRSVCQLSEPCPKSQQASPGSKSQLRWAPGPARVRVSSGGLSIFSRVESCLSIGIVDSRSTVAGAWQEAMNQLDNRSSGMFEAWLPSFLSSRQVGRHGKAPALALWRVVEKSMLQVDTAQNTNRQRQDMQSRAA